jgi:hypothetical protein
MKWMRPAARFAFVALVPMLPILGYACSSAPPFTFNTGELALPNKLEPQPRMSTGFPAVASGEKECRRRGAPSPFSWNAIRERARRWDVGRLKVPRWRLMKTDHFVIRGDAAIDDMRFAGVYLEEGLAVMKSLLGGPHTDAPFEVRVFGSWDEFHYYAAVCGVQNAESFYNPMTFEVVVYRGKGGSSGRFAAALLHELTHLYIHRAFGRTRPVWLTEGLAEFFSRHDVSSGTLRVGLADTGTVSFLRRAAWLPLAELLRLGRDDFYSRDSDRAYAHSWLLIHTLVGAKGYGRFSRVRTLLGDRHNAITPGDVAALERRMKSHLEKVR